MIKNFTAYILESRKYLDYRSIDYLETLTPDELGKLFLATVDSSSPSMKYIQNILDVGCPIDARDEFSWTPLHHAARWGHFEIVKFLVSNGADINARTINDRTPLHWAARYGYIEIVKFLISNGGDVMVVDEDGKTSWDLASNKTKKLVPELKPNK